MPEGCRWIVALPLIAAGTLFYVAPAAAQADCKGPPRKINIGVSVSPPNVVHTSPYVAKELGIFAKHCIDASIIQFDGGGSPASKAAASQGTALVSVRSEEHTSALQSHLNLVCRLLLDKKKPPTMATPPRQKPPTSRRTLNRHSC